MLICGSLALFYSVNKHELEILHEYEDASIQSHTIATIVIIFITDTVAFVVSLLNIFILFFIQTKLCSKRFQHLRCCLRLLICVHVSVLKTLMKKTMSLFIMSGVKTAKKSESKQQSPMTRKVAPTEERKEATRAASRILASAMEE